MSQHQRHSLHARAAAPRRPFSSGYLCIPSTRTGWSSSTAGGGSRRTRFTQVARYTGLLLAAVACIVLRDRAQRRACQGELTRARAEARTDPLTGLPNRAEVTDRLTGQAGGHPVQMLALLDLDGFKQVNDTCGHDAGDDLLTDIADRLTHATRPASNAGAWRGNGLPIGTALAARLAGDEFVLLWEQAPAGDPLTHVRHLLHEVAEPAGNSSARLPVGISAGIALAGEHLNGTSLLIAADAAMYQAKNSGGDPGQASSPGTGGSTGTARLRVCLWNEAQPPARAARRGHRDASQPAAPASDTTAAAADASVAQMSIVEGGTS